MPGILEHWPDLLTIATVVVMITVGWQKTKDRLIELGREIKRVESHFNLEVARIENMIEEDLDSCHEERLVLAKSISNHHEDPKCHVTEEERRLQMEWRRDVMDKLNIIQKAVLKINGS